LKFFVSCLLALCAFWVQASPIPDFPFVTVAGNSSKQVAPDKATLSFHITSFHQSSEVANAQLTQTVNKVLTILKANGVSDKQITAFEVEKHQKRKRDDNVSYSDLDVIGYDMFRRFEVEITDLKKYPALMTQLYATDNAHSFETTFDNSQRESIKAGLIGEAAAQARKNAEMMAEGLGVKIHSVFAFNDTGSFEDFVVTFSLINAGGQVQVQGASMGSDDVQQIFIPQSIEISKTVNVIYKITP